DPGKSTGTTAGDPLCGAPRSASASSDRGVAPAASGAPAGGGPGCPPVPAVRCGRAGDAHQERQKAQESSPDGSRGGGDRFEVAMSEGAGVHGANVAWTSGLPKPKGA